MPLRDLLKSDCNGVNSLIEFSTHFTQDLAFRDKDLKVPVQTNKSDEQNFLEASSEELLKEFHNFLEIKSFKMEEILSEMRNAEENFEETWSMKFSENIEKQEQPFGPNICSSSGSEILAKDEVNDLDHLEWVKEMEQLIENQEINVSKSKFDCEKNEEKAISVEAVNTESKICDNVMEPQEEMYTKNINVDMPMNNFGMDLFGNPLLVNQDFQQNMFGRLSDLWNHYASMPLQRYPISDIGQSSTVEQLAQINTGNTRLENEQADSQMGCTKSGKKNFEGNKDSLTPDSERLSMENPLAEGKRLLKIGELPKAMLCFEAAVKQEPTNAEAWQLLGITQSENEKDQLAINSLKKCLEIQPENLIAIFGLAACYSNENENLKACHMLIEWLNQNPKYSDIVKSKTLPKESHVMKHLLTKQLSESIMEMYLEAIQRSFKTGFVDADVQNGLGVLLCLNNVTDKALDCFNVALQIRPLDARLWNRLGATLANDGQFEEAKQAYLYALELCPGFIRARHNLGIACIQLETYKEAIGHLLGALNQQAAAVTNSESPVLSEGIWCMLRMAISLAEYTELIDAVYDRDLNSLNEEFNKIKED